MSEIEEPENDLDMDFVAQTPKVPSVQYQCFPVDKMVLVVPTTPIYQPNLVSKEELQHVVDLAYMLMGSGLCAYDLLRRMCGADQ